MPSVFVHAVRVLNTFGFFGNFVKFIIMKLDLHVHIRRDHRLEDVQRAVKARGLDGIAVTNFHNVSFAHYLREHLSEILIIVGQEVESTRGHILAIGIEEKIPDGLEPEDTIRLIHAQAGLAILAHPYLVWNSILPHGRARHWPFDAIEYFNHRCGPLLWPNFLAKLGVRTHPLPKVANTDSKELSTIGLCHNEVPVATGGRGMRYTQRAYEEIVPEILHCIRKGQVNRRETWEMPSWNWYCSNVSRLFMPHKHYTCFHCEDRIVYKLIRRTYTCLLCGRQEARHVCCARGHFVCKICRTRLAYETEEFTAYREKIETR
jgi:hypothetical protein